ncbi:diguanylate cyclase (GGDEF)-like protein [Actinoplanes lutulentus]|uniref:Diguanylate cyclase (GGDEF)-like protein n=1 Tax=Actinoplanes lutulentus TaxID=1287878 RepID=A0A327ZB15_9ACTN|nr:GGDEF domain-containing protein [Actinoplanes lutulentus]MBB2949217.1 diguanylate cyclase (GGDEF)-like protein [Actinoplanes lutulentus]RAK34632.1 diguanylate cyclase (GGDEF)-like protein [Actinoplanes lutulentus]
MERSSKAAERRREIIAPALRHDPLLTAATWWTILAVILLFTLAGHTESQVRVFWAFQVPLDVLLAYSSWRVSRVATGPTRRFWRVLTLAGLLFVIGDTTQTITVLLNGGQGLTNGGTVQTACFGVGLAALIVAMLAHPHPQRSGRERLAFWLDSATVMVGGAVVAWCFTADTSGSTADLIANLAAGGVILTAAFASAKMSLNGNAPMHKAAVLPMVISSAFNSVGFFLAPGSAATLPAYVFAIRFLPSLLIAAGPRTQEIIARFDQTAFGAKRRKPYSLLPYGSIAVVFTALVVLLSDESSFQNVDESRLWGVIIGLGVIIALVAGRQLVAFHDNTRLIKELDHTLAELREHEIRLRHQANTDGLTGLANRTHLQEEMAEALDGHQPGTVSLLLIDLDGFKAVNDTLGHPAGDALLAGVARRLTESVRGNDLVARLGGDEFAVLLRECDTTAAEHTARRILRSLETPLPVGNGAMTRANASIGAATAGPDADIETLLRDADIAMYAAKHAGKGCWRSYTPALAGVQASEAAQALQRAG